MTALAEYAGFSKLIAEHVSVAGTPGVTTNCEEPAIQPLVLIYLCIINGPRIGDTERIDRVQGVQFRMLGSTVRTRIKHDRATTTTRTENNGDALTAATAATGLL